MVRNLRQERQLLTAEEFALVEKSHAPFLMRLSDQDLAALLGLVRKRRDRSRDIAARQRREVRGRTPPKSAGAARSLSESARRALELRRAAKVTASHPSAGHTASKGKQAKTFAPVKAPRNPAKEGAVSQHTKNMQAKRDAKSRRAAT